jgi:hypothetical protein
MPRPRKNLDRFQTQIELEVASGQTQKEIRSWLATQGVRVSKNTFSARCVAWSATRHLRTAVSEPTLVTAVETAFYTTQYDDETITRNINTQGIVKGSARRWDDNNNNSKPRGGGRSDHLTTKKEEEEEEDACCVARDGRPSYLYSLCTMCVTRP